MLQARNADSLRSTKHTTRGLTSCQPNQWAEKANRQPRRIDIVGDPPLGNRHGFECFPPRTPSRFTTSCSYMPFTSPTAKSDRTRLVSAPLFAWEIRRHEQLQTLASIAPKTMTFFARYPVFGNANTLKTEIHRPINMYRAIR